MEIKITGLDEAIRKLDELAAETSAPQMARRMGSVRCPVHGTVPTNVRVVGTEVKAEFCCDKARKLALDAALRPIRAR
jgi:hypothetical protein